jgi:enoyl-CoA hydratase/carnithine racemase
MTVKRVELDPIAEALEHMPYTLQTIATATEDAREGPRAFREKRPPVFEGR